MHFSQKAHQLSYRCAFFYGVQRNLSFHSCSVSLLWRIFFYFPPLTWGNFYDMLYYYVSASDEISFQSNSKSYPPCCTSLSKMEPPGILLGTSASVTWFHTFHCWSDFEFLQAAQLLWRFQSWASGWSPLHLMLHRLATFPSQSKPSWQYSGDCRSPFII